jgi:uncharacterized membrane protein SpoIIM required for sporulation
MTKMRFLELRRPAWQRYHTLLEKAERLRMRQFTGDEISELSRLFRAVCYDLATVRSRDWGQDLERYLNDLVARGHNNFYRSPPGRPREAISFFLHGFPRLLRANIRYFWVAFVLFYLPGTICGVLVGRNPSLASRVLSGEQQLMMEEMYSEAPSSERRGGMEAAMTGFYVWNNVGIAFRCFATGILFGIGTIFILIQNSIFLGAVSGFLIAQGHGDRFLSFVISHGSFELTAIVVSGAAGLVVGHALVHPGPYPRAQALLRRGLVGVQLALGAGGMLVVAALVEAWWSPSEAPTTAKYVVGTLLWILVILYLSLAGRERISR